MGLVVEHFRTLYVASPPYRPLCFFAPLPFKIAPKGGIPPTWRNAGLLFLRCRWCEFFANIFLLFLLERNWQFLGS